MAARKGRYKVENPEKYRGDPTQVIYRSSWELKVMKRFDRDPNVLAWSSETIVIGYKDRSTGRFRRYFPDFWWRRADGKEFLVEVKPLKETLPPKKGSSEKRFITEVATYAKNQSKWEAARRFCAERDWEFVVLTEREIGV